MLAGAAAGRAADLKLPEKFRPIVEMANTAPPEFGADALERLVAAGVDDQPTRRELIERAFQFAAHAHDRWRVRALPRAPAAAAMHARASELELDQISLQTRAVRLMLAFDPPRARALFLEVPGPAPAPLTCDDWEGADLGDFYSTLGLIADQTFTPAEKRHEDDIHLLAGYLGAITSPFQFQPALRMVLDLKVKTDQRHALLVQLGSAMAAIPADDRSIASISEALTPEVPGELQPSFQRFLASHATASPCGASAPDKSWAESADEQRIAKDERELMFPRGAFVSAAGRATPEWQTHLDDFLSEMVDWRQSPDESDASFYHRKMSADQGLLDVTSGSLRVRLIDDMIRVALDSDLQRDAPAEWFLELRAADERMRAGTARGPDVLRGFERSGNPALVLAAQLDRALGK